MGNPLQKDPKMGYTYCMFLKTAPLVLFEAPLFLTNTEYFSPFLPIARGHEPVF